MTNKCGVYFCEHHSLNKCADLERTRETGCTLSRMVELDPELFYLQMTCEAPCYIASGKVIKLKVKAN